MTASAQSRARGSLLGLAIGDALGMPTQYMPRSIVSARYGILDRFDSLLFCLPIAYYLALHLFPKTF